MVLPAKFQDTFMRQVRATVERHGAKGDKLWRLASGYNPAVSPATALTNLKNVVEVVRSDFEDECRALIRDLDALFKQ